MAEASGDNAGRSASTLIERMDLNAAQPLMAKTTTVTLKIAGVAAVLLLALIGILLVLDVIPREAVKEVTVKTMLVIGIVTAASLIIGLLVRSRGEP